MMTVANAIVARSLLCGTPCTAWAKRSNTSAIHCRIRSSSVFVMSRRYAGCFTMAATVSCMAVRGQTGTVPPAATCGAIIEPTLAVSASARLGGLLVRAFDRDLGLEDRHQCMLGDAFADLELLRGDCGDPFL